MTRSPAHRWTRRVGAVLALLLVVVLVEAIGWRHERWGAELESVRFVDHPEKITASAASMTVTGYLVATIASDVDFFRLARTDTASPKVEAALCESGKPLGAWFDPLPRDPRAGAKPYSYAILIPMRAREVDLSTTSEEVCLRFRATGRNPLSWIRSKRVVVPLAPALRAQLASYAREDGIVELVLDPACAPQLCEPQFSADDLNH